MSKGKTKYLEKFIKNFYIAFEGLSPDTNYTLLIYAITQSSTVKPANLAVNQTFLTLKSNKLLSPPKVEEPDYEEVEDYEYYYSSPDEDEDDDNEDTTQQNESAKRIIKCDLTRKEVDSREASTRSSLGSESLFYEMNKQQQKSQIISINYSINQMSRLLDIIANSSEKSQNKLVSFNEENFINFFELIKFMKNRQNDDFSINHDCLKQFKQTKSSKPLCMFKIEPENESQNEDYEDYEIVPIDSNSYFSVHTAFKSDKSPLIYVSSSCHRTRRPSRNPNGRSITLGTTQTTTLYTTTSTTAFTSSTTVIFDQEKLSQYKKSSGKIYKHLTAVENCMINENKQIEFYIEGYRLSEDSAYFKTNVAKRITYLNESVTPYYYIVDIEVPHTKSVPRSLHAPATYWIRFNLTETSVNQV